MNFTLESDEMYELHRAALPLLKGASKSDGPIEHIFFNIEKTSMFAIRYQSNYVGYYILRNVKERSYKLEKTTQKELESCTKVWRVISETKSPSC